MSAGDFAHKVNPLKLVIVGHVDHGKSTLIGRLAHDMGLLPEGTYEKIAASCKKRGVRFEWAFLLDSLQAERDQGITIDVTHMEMRIAGRPVTIIDAPGHKEFLKNMISGAAQADAALLVIDAGEGISEQSRRHGMLLHALGVRQFAVIVNKMDKTGYSEAAFDAIRIEYGAYLKTLGMEPLCFIPVSAGEGEGILSLSTRMPWHKGFAVSHALTAFEAAPAPDEKPLRFLVQDVYKLDERRIVAGHIASGTMKRGDTLLFSPNNVTARVKSIEIWPAQLAEASAGQAVGLTLEDPLFIERGQVASHEQHAPMLSNVFRASVFWLGKEALLAGNRYQLKLGTSETIAEIREIRHVMDMKTLDKLAAERVEYGQIAELVIRTRRLMAVDEHIDNPTLGRFVLLDRHRVAGGGTVSMEGCYNQRDLQKKAIKSQHLSTTEFGIDAQLRACQNGHLGGVLWFSGLSGAGKSTIAVEAQKALLAKGYQAFVLDGDNIRKGLCGDLGFSASDRRENIRRVAEVAALFASAGVIVISAFISPFREDRRRARALAPDAFHNIYIKASLEACEKRDAKGLYKKARAGEIEEFTGINSPYEEPENPDLLLNTEETGIAACVDALINYIEHHLVEPVKNMTLKEAQNQDRAGTDI